MPTQYSKKHTNEASMSLWRASTIHHLMAEQVDVHRKIAKRSPEEALPAAAATPVAPRRANIAPSLPQTSGKRYGTVPNPAIACHTVFPHTYFGMHVVQLQWSRTKETWS